MTVPVSDPYSRLIAKLHYQKHESQWLRRVLQAMLTPQEAELADAVPASPAELAAKLNTDEETINRMTDKLIEKGVIVQSRRGVVMPTSLEILHDFVMLSPSVSKEMCQLWQEFAENEWFELLADKWPVEHPWDGRWRWPWQWREGGSFELVIPAWKALEKSKCHVIPREDLRQIVEEAEVRQIQACPCRVRAKQCDNPVDICLVFTKLSQFSVTKPREVSKEEALELLGKAEDLGLVHCAPATSAVCNCCSDCCMVLRPLLKYGKVHEGLGKSSYFAIVDEDACTGCQICMDRCVFDAIELRRVEASGKSKRYKAFVDIEKCFGCGACVIKCPEDALKLDLRPGALEALGVNDKVQAKAPRPA